jgi:hypothetical protein
MFVSVGPLKEKERRQEIEAPEHALARLGAGWLGVGSHDQLLTVLEKGFPVPVVKVYYLERQVDETAQT